jgi:hypothetical protein
MFQLRNDGVSEFVKKLRPAGISDGNAGASPY